MSVSHTSKPAKSLFIHSYRWQLCDWSVVSPLTFPVISVYLNGTAYWHAVSWQTATEVILVSGACGWITAANSNWFLKMEVEVGYWSESLLLTLLCLMVLWTFQLWCLYWCMLLPLLQVFVLLNRVFRASILFLLVFSLNYIGLYVCVGFLKAYSAWGCEWTYFWHRDLVTEKKKRGFSCCCAHFS